MKCTFSKHALDVMESRNVKMEWVEHTLEHPSRVDEISLDEHRYFSTINGNEHRCLKMLVNLSTNNIITAYFDRNMKKRGCK